MGQRLQSHGTVLPCVAPESQDGNSTGRDTRQKTLERQEIVLDRPLQRRLACLEELRQECCVGPNVFGSLVAMHVAPATNEANACTRKDPELHGQDVGYRLLSHVQIKGVFVDILPVMPHLVPDHCGRLV